jgi:hypothetical protein
LSQQRKTDIIFFDEEVLPPGARTVAIALIPRQRSTAHLFARPAPAFFGLYRDFR